MTTERITPAISVKVLLPGKQKPERLDEDAAKRVLSLTYEDAEKMADKCTLTLDNYDLRFPDDGLFDQGNGLVVAWGYLGDMGPAHEMVITGYLPGPVLTVTALDRSLLLMVRPRDQVYLGQTYSGIAREIAARNGYGVDAQDIDESGVVIEAVAQHNRTDWQLLSELAREVSWQLWVDGAGLHFKERRLRGTPQKVVTYRLDGAGHPIGELLAFPTFEAMPALQPGSVQLKGTDPLTKKPIDVKANNASTKRDGLADVIEVLDVETAQTSLQTLVTPAVVASTSATTPAEAQQRASGLYKKAQATPKKCSMPVRGDPHFTAKSVVEVRGLGTRLSGNYYVSDCTHNVAPGNYTMTWKARRDGTNAAGGAHPAAKSDAAVNHAKGAAGDAAADPQPIDVVDPETGQTSTVYKPPGAKGTTP